MLLLQVMSGKRFRVQPPRVQPEILNVVLKVGQWVAASGTAVLMIAGVHPVGAPHPGLRHLALAACGCLCGIHSLRSGSVVASYL